MTLASTDERLARADMQELLGKIVVTMTPDITTEYNAGRYVDLIELAMRLVRERWNARAVSGAAPIPTPSIRESARLPRRLARAGGNGGMHRVGDPIWSASMPPGLGTLRAACAEGAARC